MVTVKGMPDLACFPCLDDLSPLLRCDRYKSIKDGRSAVIEGVIHGIFV